MVGAGRRGTVPRPRGPATWSVPPALNVTRPAATYSPSSCVWACRVGPDPLGQIWSSRHSALPVCTPVASIRHSTPIIQ